MLPRERTNILIVDDQPAKLLSLESIITPLGENVLKCSSGEEALQVLLAHDVAVLLMDVCMPGMDGFELAELVRQHPRFARTAIIFISAVNLADSDRLRGYALGAVDYIPVPIIPEVLRAKVSVFIELHRKKNELERLNRELEARVAERTADLEQTNLRLGDSERRYRELVQSLPVAVFTSDNEGRIILYNQAAVDLWGKEPVSGQDYWSDCYTVLREDGEPVPLKDCPMSRALRDRQLVQGAFMIQRPDGTRRYVQSHPQPMVTAEGELTGVINVHVDVTAQRAAQLAVAESEARFRLMADSAPALIWIAGENKDRTWFNRPWLQFTGRTLEQESGNGWTQGVHPEDRARSVEIFESAFDARREFSKEYRLRRHDGEYRWVLSHGLPLYDARGRFNGYIGSCIDVTDQVRARQLQQEQQALLESAIKERTAELAVASEQLRLADRMATIGTLSAGLGHDMGNLLLPVRMRLDAMEASELPKDVREDISAIRKATEYLQRLASSLRLLAVDPEGEHTSLTPTALESWWNETEGMLQNGIHRPAMLSGEIDPDLPPVAIGKAALTQAAFNLVQNAGDALKGREDGRVEVKAWADGERVFLSVRDNGPGMNPEARQRCMEPFFTTKTRGLSTGLGLTLVNGLVVRCGGSMQIKTEAGKGTEVILNLPAAATGASPRVQSRRGIAVVKCEDLRLNGYLQTVLRSMSYEVRQGEPCDDASVWVTDSSDDNVMLNARNFVTGAPGRKAVLLGDINGEEPHRGVIHLGSRLRPSVLRTQLGSVLQDQEP